MAIMTKLAVAWCYSGSSGMLEGVVVVGLIKTPLLKGWPLSWLLLDAKVAGVAMVAVVVVVTKFRGPI